MWEVTSGAPLKTTVCDVGSDVGAPLKTTVCDVGSDVGAPLKVTVCDVGVVSKFCVYCYY